MSKVGQREIQSQRRVVGLFSDALEYSYLGNWKNRVGKGNIEKKLLTDWLKRQGPGRRGQSVNFLSPEKKTTEDTENTEEKKAES